MNEKVVFVDFDGTMINGQSQVLLIKYLYTIKEISTFLLLRVLIWSLKYKLVNQKIEKKFAEGIYKLVLSGRQEKQTGKIIGTYIDEIIGKVIYKKVLKLLYEYKKEGYRIIFISSSLDIILSAFNNKYELADEIICTTLEKDKGKYTGGLVGNINDGLERENRVLSKIKEISPSKIVVISDNITDINILKNADKAIVVNPNRDMTKFAKSFNFEIIKI